MVRLLHWSVVRLSRWTPWLELSPLRPPKKANSFALTWAHVWWEILPMSFP